jgi:hypothetical protein
VAVLFASLSAGATMEAAVNRAAADEMGRAAIRVQTLEERGLGRDTARVVSETAGVGVAAPALERKTYLAVSLSQTPTAKLPPPVTVLGIDAWAEPYLHDMPLSGGRLLAVDDTAAAIVSQALASQEELALGGTIILNGGVEAGPTSFTVVGILSGDGSLPEADGSTPSPIFCPAPPTRRTSCVRRRPISARRCCLSQPSCCSWELS